MKKFAMFLFLLSSITFAQERMILKSNGEQIKLNHKKDLREAITESKIKRNDGKIFKSQFISKQSNAAEYVDTLSYRRLDGDWNTNFGFFGQDVMLQWFEATTDMTIQGIGFTCSDDAGAENATISLRLIRLNWTKEQLKNFSTDTQIGYFPSSADGMNNVDPFGEVATGDWVSTNEDNPLPPWTNNENPDLNTFKYELWADSGFGWPIFLISSPSDAPFYQWIDISNSGQSEVVIAKGEIFAVVATHDGINLDAERIGFWSDATVGYPGWKYYENGKSGADVDPGWWVRMFTWDFAVAVEIQEPPHTYISDLTNLPTTLSTEPRTVEATIIDSNPGGSESGIAEANLIYTINGGEEISVLMTANGDIYSAQIPGQSPGTEVTYCVRATDLDGNLFKSIQTYTYNIFLAKDDNNLIVFNGFTSPNGYPQQYYFGTDNSYAYNGWTYDSWAYGALTKELVDNYKNIFEICTTGPSDYNREVITEWLSADGERNYLLAGEEWLGADNGYTDQDYSAGSFEYDILGITHSYNDISYDGTSGQDLPSRLFPQEGTELGGAMFDKATELNAVDTVSIDSILYDPMYEIGITSNWLDGFEIIEGDETSEVFMKAETRGIKATPEVREVNVGVSRILPAGNKIVFMTYDPISIDSSPSYYWFGQGDVSQTTKSLFWFGANIVGVEEIETQPEAFSLSQNYPNPFNPSTTIKYSIPRDVRGEKQEVRLMVYDILGREVETLVNKQQQAGNYEVNFNANNLSSGIYFYKLQSGSYTKSMKMLLIK